MTSPRTPLLIGLIGRAGAGKTTVAQHLEAHWGFVHIAFADPILAMVHALFDEAGVDGAWATERVLKEQPAPVLGVSYRRLAQTIGTECGRRLDEALWINVASHKLAQARLHQHHVVVSDIRFVNEAHWVQDHGGVLVHVIRPDAPTLAPDAAGHISETLAARLVPTTLQLRNGASITTLCNRVDDMMRSLHGLAA